MIPHLVTYRQRRHDGRWLRVYVPVLPVVLLLSPLLLLAVLGGVVACLIFGVSPVGALRGAGRLLWALPGARFEIEQGRMAVLVSVR
ncbi:hypothetical protein GCM10022225_81450 [Plantactinospora mayteni]|uniref:Uncharacterized protein n=1 Tax=Plantactinospora mayteni TaxID=566021 RepID=A0ABQ4F3S1_9ACTN|nr:hypothetical protein [Plantactinospora mayteni]GIH01538.1 hypothetical protein Pma05_81100 [Plantactinospora mayteni]